jgi:hypothetical protein
MIRAILRAVTSPFRRKRATSWEEEEQKLRAGIVSDEAFKERTRPNLDSEIDTELHRWRNTPG